MVSKMSPAIVYVILKNGRILKQRTNVRRTGRHVGMDFVDLPVEFVRLARSLGADCADALASVLTASQAILFDDVDRSFAPV
jgi:hypothetical protein